MKVTRWTVIDVSDTLPEYGIVVSNVMEPYRKWCRENIGSMELPNRAWWNDLYGSWWEFHFPNTEDAMVFMLVWGGKIRQ